MGFVFFVVAVLLVVALIGLLLWFFFLWESWGSIRVRESASAEGCSAVVVAGDDDWAEAGSAGERQRLRSALGLRRRAGAPLRARKVPHRTAGAYSSYP